MEGYNSQCDRPAEAGRQVEHEAQPARGQVGLLAAEAASRATGPTFRCTRHESCFVQEAQLTCRLTSVSHAPSPMVQRRFYASQSCSTKTWLPGRRPHPEGSLGAHLAGF